MSLARMVRAQAGMELRLTLRRGESLLLTLVIPLALLAFFGTVDVLGTDIDMLAPGVVALAVMSTSMTGLAIATAFERQHGVLKRLGATPLSRPGLLLAKMLAVLAVEALQVALLVPLALALGWSPHGAWAMPVYVLLGTAAFSGIGLLMAGTLRAEATLAAANGLYLVLLLASGMLVPLTDLPGPVRSVARLLPGAALADGLRAGTSGRGVTAFPVVVLLAWAVASVALAARTFRWE